MALHSGFEGSNELALIGRHCEERSDGAIQPSGFLDTAVELDNPDFAAMARGAGIFAKRVEDPAELTGVMREWLAHDGPSLLDVVSARQELAMPPKVGVEQATGFGLWLMKAVIDGRGRQIVDLARTNLVH